MRGKRLRVRETLPLPMPWRCHHVRAMRPISQTHATPTRPHPPRDTHLAVTPLLALICSSLHTQVFNLSFKISKSVLMVFVFLLLKVCSFICYKNYHRSQLYNFTSLFLFLGFNSSLIGARALVSRDPITPFGLNHCLLWYFWSMVKQNSVGNFMLSELEPFLYYNKNMEISVSGPCRNGECPQSLVHCMEVELLRMENFPTCLYWEFLWKLNYPIYCTWILFLFLFFSSFSIFVHSKFLNTWTNIKWWLFKAVYLILSWTFI